MLIEGEQTQSKAPTKNIIICSDGTGNRGGVTNDTNVRRIYDSIDLTQSNDSQKLQLTHYDDGVGTEDFKYLKILGGAFGWGTTRNIIQSYKFLCRNFNLKDDIYLFGFSRGAYTVRALSAFVTYMGIIKDATNYSDDELEKLIERLINIYWKRPRKNQLPTIEEYTNAHKKIREDRCNQLGYVIDKLRNNETKHQVQILETNIKYIGVWDTVSAIGLPFDIGLKRIFNSLFKFSFHDNNLSDRVESASHAIAIDDQRKTFHPEVWEERNNLSQVFFSGVHSNVGGGYPKQGMSYVALKWMLEEDGIKDLRFKQGFKDEVDSKANVHDKLYNSRAGLAIYYRYKPRFINKINRLKNINVHYSCIERISRQSLDYNPVNFILNDVQRIDIVDCPNTSTARNLESKISDTKQQTRLSASLINSKQIVDKLETTYLAFVMLTLLVVACVLSAAITLWCIDDATNLSLILITKYACWVAVPLSLISLSIFVKSSLSKKLVIVCSQTLLWIPIALPNIIDIPQIAFAKIVAKAIDKLLTPINAMLPEKLDLGLKYFIENQQNGVTFFLALFILITIRYVYLRKKLKQKLFDSWKWLRH